MLTAHYWLLLTPCQDAKQAKENAFWGGKGHEEQVLVFVVSITSCMAWANPSSQLSEDNETPMCARKG